MKNLFIRKKYTFLAILSAVALSIGWLSVSGILMLVAFVPLFWISSQTDASKKGLRKMALYISLALGLWSAVTTWWIWYAAPIGAILSVIITVVMMGGCFLIYHYVSKKAPKSLAYTMFVCLWVGAEYLYTIGQVSFPWIIIGNGFANDVAIIQWYEFTGVFGGSFWVLVANIMIWEAIRYRSKSKIVAAAVWVVLPIILSLVLWFNYQVTDGQRVNVQVLQPNIDPYTEKFNDEFEGQTQRLVDLAMEAPSDVDYIITPETSLDSHIWEHNLETNAQIDLFRQTVLKKYPQTQLILGSTTFRRYTDQDKSQTARYFGTNNWYDIFNSAIVMDASEIRGVHHKSKLVVGVEKLPFRSITKYLDFLIIDLGGTTGQMGVDSVRKVFLSEQEIVTGTAICYESVYGDYFSEFVRRGAELMFVITNDGWWRDTPGYRQHFSFARIRAIESRRAIARSANTGISGFIDQRGRVIEKSRWDEMVSMNAELTTNSELTVYTKYGDALARVCCYVLFLSIFYFIAYRFRMKNHLV